MHNLKTPYPFHTWAMDFVRPTMPPSQGKRWILATTENFMKWVEAVALREANAEVVVRFLKEKHHMPFWSSPKDSVRQWNTFYQPKSG